MKDLIQEGRKIHETFKRKLNEDNTVTPTTQAKQAAKFFLKVYKSWFAEDGITINGEYKRSLYSNQVGYIVTKLTSTGGIIYKFHLGITEAWGDEYIRDVNTCAKIIQNIVESGGTRGTDIPGRGYQYIVNLKQYLAAIPKFANEVDKLVKQADDRESKKILTDYKNSVQKFAALLKVVPKN